MEPPTVALARLSEVTVRYGATNRTTAPFDATDFSLEWQVDGRPSLPLGMAFGNGAREAKWVALPAGESVADERRGVTFVEAPGEHVISLHHLGREVARATLRVSP